MSSIAAWIRGSDTHVITVVVLTIIACWLVLAIQMLIATSGFHGILLKSAYNSGFVESERA
jgi:NADH:ubiquinone oxidoreductase subunit 3 (subunit A)